MTGNIQGNFKRNFGRNLKKSFETNFERIFEWCLGFVIWQTIQCIKNYIDKPIGTKLSIKKSADLPFPAITVCGKFGVNLFGFGHHFNETYLKKNCGIE